MLRRRALIVEDDEELRRLFTVGLKFEGYDVVEAADGLAALRQVDYCAPDIVVLDLGLPHVNGVAVLQEIAAHAVTRRIPVVVVTGSTEDLDHLDVACVLRKPVSLDRLAQAVRECMATGAAS